MKSFVGAIILLCIVTAFVVTNAVILDSVCEDIANLLDQNRTEEAYGLWKKKESYLSYFLNFRDIELIEEEAENMHSYFLLGNTEETEASRVRLLVIFDELRDAEKPLFSNIF